MRHFTFSFIFTAIALGLGAWWGYSTGGIAGALTAVAIVTVLGLMEISLSFDNAVVNASVIKNWDKFWQTMFLTVGVFVAVFGMRLLFPLLIVSMSSDMNILQVFNMAINQPEEYSTKVMDSYGQISAFGGMFLLLVFLNYFLDSEKDVHWLHWIEEKAGMLGRIDAVSVLIAMGTLLVLLQFAENSEKAAILLAGVWGIMTYLMVDFGSNLLEKEEEEPLIGKIVKRGSIGAFIYLEVLDASFSFDGVIGALAISKDIIVIMLGLGVGAMFVRSMTVYLVDNGTLNEYVYLEHGAHYAIGALALIMLASMHVHIPEYITGLIGISLIGLAFYSSLRYKRINPEAAEQIAAQS
jgi:hypothetical protein